MRTGREALAATALFLCAAVPVGGGAGWMIHEANTEQASAENQAEVQIKCANIREEHTLSPTAPQARGNCRDEEDHTPEQTKHDIVDLETQQINTIWTHYSGLAVILGTAFGLLGFALLLLTFWQNKRSADAAHDANRPWIEGNVPTGIAMGFKAEEIGLSADVGVINHGKSPATNVLAQARLVAISETEQETKSALTIIRSGIEKALDEWEERHPHRGKTVYPGRADNIIVLDRLSVAALRKAQGEPPTKIIYLLAVGISYRFRGKRGRTVTAYLLSIKNNPHLYKVPYDVGAGETRVADANIVLTDTHEGYAT